MEAQRLCRRRWRCNCRGFDTSWLLAVPGTSHGQWVIQLRAGLHRNVDLYAIWSFSEVTVVISSIETSVKSCCNSSYRDQHQVVTTSSAETSRSPMREIRDNIELKAPMDYVGPGWPHAHDCLLRPNIGPLWHVVRVILINRISNWRVFIMIHTIQYKLPETN